MSTSLADDAGISGMRSSFRSASEAASKNHDEITKGPARRAYFLDLFNGLKDLFEHPGYFTGGRFLAKVQPSDDSASQSIRMSVTSGALDNRVLVDLRSVFKYGDGARLEFRDPPVEEYQPLLINDRQVAIHRGAIHLPDATEEALCTWINDRLRPALEAAPAVRDWSGPV